MRRPIPLSGVSCPVNYDVLRREATWCVYLDLNGLLSHSAAALAEKMTEAMKKGDD
jgi:hypothetical protein